MRNLIRSMLVMVAIVAVPASAGGGAKSGELPKEAKKGVEKAMKKFEQGWNQQDPKAMADVYAQDGNYINPAGKEAKGKQEVEQLFKEELNQQLKGSRAELSLDQARQLQPDMVLADMKVNVQGMVGPNGQKMPEQQMHAVVLMKREGEDWKVLEARPYTFMDEQMSQQGIGGAGQAGEMETTEPPPQPEPEGQPMTDPMTDPMPEPAGEPMP